MKGTIMRSLTIIATVTGGIIASILGVIFFLSLWPYFPIIGKLLIGLLAVLIGCAAFLTVTWTYHRIALMTIHRRNHVIAVDGVVVLIRNGEIQHLSAQHEAAKVKQIEGPKVTIKEVSEEEDDPSDLEILSLAEKGVSGRQIEKRLGLSHHKVTTTINAWKAKHNMV